MGKEGGYWGGGRSLKRVEPETPSAGCISSFFHFFDFHPFHFSLQQLQQQQPSSHHCHHTTTTTIPKGTEAPRNSLESEDGTMVVVGSISKQENLEIPKRNKLSIKTTSTGISSSSTSNNGNNKVGNIIVNDILSPGTKTPTLVARLMGLDLLPDHTQSPSSSSPSSSSTTTSSSCLSATKSKVAVNPHPLHHHHLRPRQQHNVMMMTKPRHSMDDSIAASRFLPDDNTPHRISSARRSDVEHRLSLQINKENMSEDLELLPRFSFSKLKFEGQNNSSNNNRSPRQYAKQIVKQMRESMLSSRKVGIDVTNIVKNREVKKKKKQEQREGGGEFVGLVGQFKSNKKSRSRTTMTPTCSSDNELSSSPGKRQASNNNPTCSPKLRFMDPNKNKLSTVTTKTTTRKDQISISPSSSVKLDNNQQPQVVCSRVLAKPKPKPPPQEVVQLFQKKKSSSVPMKCKKKGANEKFSPGLKKPNKQDELFVRQCKKSKKSSSHLLLINLLNLNNTAVQNINSNNTHPPHQNQAQVWSECDARESKYCSNSQQLSSGSSQTYTKEEEATSSSSSSCIRLSSSTTTGESNVDELDKRKISGFMFNNNNNNNGAEFEYVSSILSRTGFAVKKGTTTTPNTTTVSVSLFHQWLSPTQPLDPSIFQHLEQQFQNQNQNSTCNIFSFSSEDRSLKPKYDVGVRCNRRLLFDLVNETLLEVVVGPPYDDVEKAVWERLGRFQSNKKCEVLEDIDSLIEMEDMREKKMKSEEEMVAEIEGNIVDTLLHETVRMVTECSR